MRLLSLLALCAALCAGSDIYGGNANKPCSGGAASHFYTEKISNHWWLCTPSGNALWWNGVYAVIANDDGTDYQGGNLQARVDAKYASGPRANHRLDWADAAARRLQSWGFTGIDYASYRYLQATNTDSQWATADRRIPTKMPYVFDLKPSIYALTNAGSRASAPSKDLMYGVKTEAYSGFRSNINDVFCPRYQEFVDAYLTGELIVTGTGSDYILGITLDDTDNLQGFGAGADFTAVVDGKLGTPGDKASPHIGWVVLVTAPTQSANSSQGVTYTDTTVYTKAEFSSWLSTRYGADIAALNTAWGSYYTTFGTQDAGFGVGTGLLDEDGLCPAKGAHACWVPTDALALTGATSAMKTDLDAFLLHFAEQYFGFMHSELNSLASGLMYLGPTNLGTWGTPPRRQILQAAGQYVDVLQLATIPPNCSDCTDIQSRYDFVAQYGGDLPWLNWDGYWAQADSYMYPYAVEGQQFTTQEQRGAAYLSRMQSFINMSATSTGTHHIAGLHWWSMYDLRGEQANWGLVTLKDNAYDGHEAATGSVACSAPLEAYTCGGESATYGAPYGDFITSVKTANALWLGSTAPGSKVKGTKLKGSKIQ